MQAPTLLVLCFELALGQSPTVPPSWQTSGRGDYGSVAHADEA